MHWVAAPTVEIDSGLRSTCLSGTRLNLDARVGALLLVVLSLLGTLVTLITGGCGPP
jgi:hypothetical protein